MHGEVAMLLGAAAGVVSWALAVALRRPAAVKERLANLSRRLEP